MKYQVRICLGNFDSWEEANAAKLSALAGMPAEYRDKVIEGRIVDSNVRAEFI